MKEFLGEISRELAGQRGEPQTARLSVSTEGEHMAFQKLQRKTNVNL